MDESEKENESLAELGGDLDDRARELAAEARSVSMERRAKAGSG